MYNQVILIIKIEWKNIFHNYALWLANYEDIHYYWLIHLWMIRKKSGIESNILIIQTKFQIKKQSDKKMVYSINKLVDKKSKFGNINLINLPCFIILLMFAYFWEILVSALFLYHRNIKIATLIIKLNLYLAKFVKFKGCILINLSLKQVSFKTRWKLPLIKWSRADIIYLPSETIHS
jgi:hypothetical protein